MLRLARATVNTIVVTVEEKRTLDDPYWLFHFKNETTGNDYYCIASNISTQKKRYDLFEITETDSSPDNENGEITLTETGQYTYKVYEQESSTNLDPENATTLCETGIAIVIKNAETETSYVRGTETGTVYKRS